MTGRRRLRVISIGVVTLLLMSMMGLALAVDLPPGGSFVDENGNVHEGLIEAIAAANITEGCDPVRLDRYCPTTAVTRGQMAAFLNRGLVLPAATKDFFADDATSIFEDDINRIAEEGISLGCNESGTSYCPDEIVTREQMAAFLVRGFSYSNPGAGDIFTDDDTSQFEGDIDRLATAGVTLGCNPPTNDRFCPSDPVLRDQMASFLGRALGLTADVPPPPGQLDFVFDVAAGVPASELASIRAGLEMAERHLHLVVGGDIDQNIRTQIIIKVVATGLGNQELGGGGACCTATADGAVYARLFFDVLHTQWTYQNVPWSLELDHQKTTAHEYAHAWQNALGCVAFNANPLGNWLIEGMANYLAYRTMIREGLMAYQPVIDFELAAALATGELDVPLQQLQINAPVWPGHVGHIAIDGLVKAAPLGDLSLRVLCEQVSSGSTLEEAFQTAFGKDLTEFYAEFEAWRLQYVG